MAYAQHPTSRSPRYATGGTSLMATRILLVLVLAVPIVGVWWALNQPSTAAQSIVKQIEGFDPKSVLSEQQGRSFLPPPEAVLPPEVNAGPPVPAQSEQVAPAVTGERVKVANTGGAGAILRAEPQTGRQVGALRDGQSLEVLERRTVGDGEWLRVKTEAGAEGWVYGRLVSSPQ